MSISRGWIVACFEGPGKRIKDIRKVNYDTWFVIIKNFRDRRDGAPLDVYGFNEFQTFKSARQWAISFLNMFCPREASP